MLISRYLQTTIRQSLVSGLATIVLGPRRVGKTTLIKKIIDENNPSVIFLNCDDPDVRNRFSDIGLTELKRFLAKYSIVVFDEAQRIKNIGLVLKMIVDEMPEKTTLATGSSSLELSNEINEPLTGRKKTFYLYPLSFLELYEHEKYDTIATASYLNDILRFGSYPHIFDLPNNSEKESYLLELANDYLYKDILEYQEIRNPEQLRKLLVALALQIGQEVSYTELASLVDIDQKTVLRYLDLLEKSFVIFRLPAFSRNLRTEISKSRKIYFYDLGIRNALIKNFNPYELRQDKGQSWENLIISERIKRDVYQGKQKNYYFWRTYAKKEIDLIEEYRGNITGFEIKWTNNKISPIKEFTNTYSASSIQLVNRENFLDFVT
jgi:hypothetical protein